MQAATAQMRLSGSFYFGVACKGVKDLNVELMEVSHVSSDEDKMVNSCSAGDPSVRGIEEHAKASFYVVYLSDQ
jgi:hypothetical protein